MSIKYGANAISAIKYGSADVSKVMLGATQVWPEIAEGWTIVNLDNFIPYSHDYSIPSLLANDGYLYVLAVNYYTNLIDVFKIAQDKTHVLLGLDNARENWDTAIVHDGTYVNVFYVDDATGLLYRNTFNGTEWVVGDTPTFDGVIYNICALSNSDGTIHLTFFGTPTGITGRKIYHSIDDGTGFSTPVLAYTQTGSYLANYYRVCIDAGKIQIVINESLFNNPGFSNKVWLYESTDGLTFTGVYLYTVSSTYATGIMDFISVGSDNYFIQSAGSTSKSLIQILSGEIGSGWGLTGINNLPQFGNGSGIDVYWRDDYSPHELSLISLVDEDVTAATEYDTWDSANMYDNIFSFPKKQPFVTINAPLIVNAYWDSVADAEGIAIKGSWSLNT